MTTNLLTANQADVETDTTGFTTINTGVTLARDTSHAWHGASSLKFRSDGTATYQGCEVRVPVAEFTASEQITLSTYFLTDATSAGATIRYYCQSDIGNIGTVGNITLPSAGTWVRFSTTVTLGSSLPSTYVAIRWDTGGNLLAINLWADGLQINSGTLAAWVAGGVVLNFNSMTAYIGGTIYQVEAGSVSVINQIGQRSTGSMRVWSAVGVTWSYGTRVTIYSAAGTLVYAGYVSKDKAYKPPGSRQGTGLLLHDLTLMDNCYKADKRVVFTSFLATSAGTIVQSLLSTVLAAEGVTATASSIAAGPTITEVIWNGKQIAAALDWLAQQSGYWWNIDLNSVLWFQPYGGIPAPFTLDGTQVTNDSNLSVTNGNNRYVNRQFVRGAFATTGVLTETIYGDGHKRGFTLSYDVASVTARDMSIYDSSTGSTYTLNSGIGTKGATGQNWYVAVGDAVCAQDTGSPVLSTSQYLTVTYKGRYPIVALASNSSLIAAQKARESGGTGYVEAVQADTKVHTQAAAFQIAGGMLSHYGQDMTLLEFDTLKSTLAEGQMLTVNLADFGLTNRQMLIQSVEMTDSRDGYNLWYHVTAVGSPYDAAQWQTYYQNLMNQQADPSDLSDTSDSSTLALLLASQITLSPTVVVHATKTTCPIVPFTIPTTVC
ncbi:MAG: hypothetical protein KGH75_00695 [Rhodospirillales bacterium]|nr:hypothetical protein [Rhodospirillales bacterium]